MSILNQGFDRYVSERVFKTTLAKYLPGAEQAHLRNRPFQAIMDSQGRVTYNHKGSGIKWNVHCRQQELQTWTGTGQNSFTATDPYEIAALDFGGYRIVDAMVLRDEILAERSGDPEVIIDNYAQMLTNMSMAMNNQIGPQYFINGYAAGNEDKWKGLKSIFQTNGNSINITTGAGRAAHQDDRLLQPSGTYANISMSLGAYGGANETGKVWPDGEAPSHFDFYSPLMVIANSHSFNGNGPHDFRNQGAEVLAYADRMVRRNKLGMRLPNYYFAGIGQVEDLQAYAREKQMILIGPSEEVKELGFGEEAFKINNGTTIVPEYSLARDEGIGLSFDGIELRCAGPTMFNPEGPERTLDQNMTKWMLWNLSQMRFQSPRNFYYVTDVAGLASG